MAVITSVDPNIIANGEVNKIVRVTGNGTSFDDTSTVAFSGAGILINSVTMVTTTELTVDLDVLGAGSAPPGVRNIEVTTGVNVDTGVGVVEVVAYDTPRILSINPVTCIQGERLDLEIVGAYTWFWQGVSNAEFEFGGAPETKITVHSTNVIDTTHCVADIEVDTDCVIGYRDVNVVNT